MAECNGVYLNSLKTTRHYANCIQSRKLGSFAGQTEPEEQRGFVVGFSST